MPDWLQNLLPITLLLAAVGVVLARLPKVELGHSDAFLRRRVMNWLPLGLLYAFLYMGRYNLSVSKNAFGDVMSIADFAWIFGVGTAVYGVSFVVNGPLTDRFGGRAAILVGAGGSILCNLLMGLVTWQRWTDDLVLVFSVLYGANMYFQSFGAVAIVKVNASWFHVRERGVFGAIFGILISLGIYFAYDWGYLIIKHLDTEWVFFIPAALLTLFWIIVAAVVHDLPSQAGHQDFDTGDATVEGEVLTVVQVFQKMLTNRIIVTIALIEACSGFLRQAIMQWYRIFAKQVHLDSGFVYDNWGLLLCCAGILGGVVAGVISDRVFESRRGPVAALLYGVMLLGSIALVFLLDSPALGALVVLMSMAVIGVHGMLSGTASMDFGGRRNAGIAVGIIDGFVYGGTAIMSLLYWVWLPEDGAEAADIANWWPWPTFMVPVAVLGLLMASTLWNATPRKGGAAH